MVVEEIVPEPEIVIAEVLVPTFELKSAVVDTSNPAGGVTVIPALILAPDTLKEVVEDGVPYVVVKAANVPEAEIVGLAAAGAKSTPRNT